METLFGLWPDLSTLLLLCGFGFAASFVDAVVGGGGMISLPALLWLGLPPLNAIATNKGAAVLGAISSAAAFLRSGKMDLWLIKRLFPLSLIGSAFGVWAVQLVPSAALRPLVVAMLIMVLVYSLLKKDWGKENHYTGLSRRMLLLSGCVAFAFGFYDGFFGPGTGSFLLFAFLMIGFDFLSAAANARALNLASNISGFALFAYAGLIDFSYAIPMGLAMIAGAYAGAYEALKHGVGYVRPLFIIMVTVLIGRQIVELLG